MFEESSSPERVPAERRSDRARRAVRPALLAALVAWLGGCDREEIARYRVPRQEQQVMPPATAAGEEPSREAVEPQSAGGLTSMPLVYATPAGWRPDSNPRPPRVAAFQIIDENGEAEVTVIPLGGQAGGLLANVNRWRDQIGLGPIDDAELQRLVQPIDAGGSRAHYVDLFDATADPAERQRTLAVAVARGDRTWFFKMQGDDAVVAKQKPAFEEFVRSVQFDARGG